MTTQARIALIRQTLVVLDRVSAIVSLDPSRQTEPLLLEALNLANAVSEAVQEERPLSDEEYSELPPTEKWLECFGGGVFGGGV